MIATSMFYVLFFRETFWAIKATAAGVCLAMIVFILLQKSRPDTGLKP